MEAIKSNKQFNELVLSNKPFILDFYADWCGPCQSLMPTVSKLANEYKSEVEILKVDVDKQKDIAAKFSVRSIPAIFFLKGNKIFDSSKGFTTEETLRKKIKALVKK